MFFCIAGSLQLLGDFKPISAVNAARCGDTNRSTRHRIAVRSDMMPFPPAHRPMVQAAEILLVACCGRGLQTHNFRPDFMRFNHRGQVLPRVLPADHPAAGMPASGPI